MIDYFTLVLTHGLMALALWRLMFRAELDAEPAAEAASRRPSTQARSVDAEATGEGQPRA